MDDGEEVSLPELFRRVPQLLDTCMGDDDHDAALLQLRLINREASQVALLGLKTYYLDLRGAPSDSIVAGATLLQSTRLRIFKVYLQLSAMYDPTTKLKEFLQQVGSALSTVHTMDLYLEDSGANPRRSARLAEAMVLMASACPSLKTLVSRGPLSTAFLQQLGQTSPHLSKMSIHAERADAATMQRIFDLLPTLIPQISSLVFPYLGEPGFMGGPRAKLPDLSARPGILSLDITSFVFTTPNEWRRLPPNLQNLQCSTIVKVPAVFAGRVVLGSLLTLTVRETVLSLEDLDQLLRAAPLLQELSSPDKGNFNIDCPLASPSVASNFAALHQRLQAGLSMNGFIKVHGSSMEEVDRPSYAPFIAKLARMPLIKRCSFHGINLAELRSLREMFPNIEDLVLVRMPGDFGDIGLMEIARCVRLSHLLIQLCPRVSPEELFVFCQRLPTVKSIYCFECLQLEKADLAACALRLKEEFGLSVAMGVMT